MREAELYDKNNIYLYHLFIISSSIASRPVNSGKRTCVIDHFDLYFVTQCSSAHAKCKVFLIIRQPPPEFLT